MLEEEEDINQITAYFSYEHFYVIYCKFWELDRDHDLYIDKQDLARHNDHGMYNETHIRIFGNKYNKVFVLFFAIEKYIYLTLTSYIGFQI